MEDDASDEVADELTCWVCFGLFADPCTLPCGHSFCRACAQGVLGRSALCPFCRAPFGPPLPGPSPALAALLKEQRAAEASRPPAPCPALDVVTRDEWVCVLRWAVAQAGNKVQPLGRAARVCSTLRRYSEHGALWRDQVRGRGRRGPPLVDCGQCVRDFPFVMARAEDGALAWKRAYARAVRTERGWRAGTVRDWQLESLRTGGEDGPVTALEWVPGAVYSAHGAQLRRWTGREAAWVAQLPDACSAVVAVTGAGVWAQCGSQLARVDAAGTVDAVVAAPGLRFACAVGETLVFASATHVHWAQGPTAAQPGVHTLVPVVGGVLAVDASGLTHYAAAGALLHRATGPAANLPAAEVLTGASALTHRLVALVSQAHCHVYDVAAHSVVTSVPGAGAAARALFADGTLALVHDHGALLYRLALGADGAVVPGPIAPALGVAPGVHANEWQLSGRRLVCAARDNSVRVVDAVDGRQLYALLGGSMQPRPDNPPHPTRPGCSFVRVQHHGVTGAFNGVVKTWTIKDQ